MPDLEKESDWVSLGPVADTDLLLREGFGILVSVLCHVCVPGTVPLSVIVIVASSEIV